MPSVKNVVAFRSGSGRQEMCDFPLDDDDEADDDVSLDTASTRPERRWPAEKSGDTASDSTTALVATPAADMTPDGPMHRFKQTLKHLKVTLLTNIVISVVVIVIVLGVSLALGWYSLIQLKPAPVIDKSIKAFNIPNHKASRMQDALDQAITDVRQQWRSRGKRSIQARRRYKMTLVYLAQGDGDHNVFTAERLHDIHKIEMDIMHHKNFTDFCYINHFKVQADPNLNMYKGCAPLNTLLTYFYPSVTNDRKIHYDSLGSQLDNINRTLTFAMTRESFFWYVDDSITTANKRSRLLRSEAHFGTPISGYSSSGDRSDEQYEKYKKFITTYPDLLDKSSTSKVRVLYGGNEIFDYQVDETFWNDLGLAVYAVVFICVFMFILTSFSVWLTFWGLVSILLSFPLALFFYRVVFNNTRLGILNGVAAFVIIGIGVDDVFVFTNTFRQSHYLNTIGERMGYTVWTAGKATFFTSFTTAAAFAANVASSIPAVHDFGLFMSLVVACCWVVVALMMPPVLNIWHRCFSKCEARCSCASKCQSGASSCLDIPTDVANIHGSEPGTLGTGEGSASSSSSLSSDVPLLEIDQDINEHEGGWPTYLGMLNQMMLEADDPLLNLEAELVESVELARKKQPKEGCGMTVYLQGLVYHGIARPVIKWRIVIAVLYLVLLAVSIGLLTQLKAASKPPQLFKPDTNLQMLADMAANFSDEGITCDECSGFYKEGSRILPSTTTTATTLTTTTSAPPRPERQSTATPQANTQPPTVKITRTTPTPASRTTSRISTTTESNEIPPDTPGSFTTISTTGITSAKSSTTPTTKSATATTTTSTTTTSTTTTLPTTTPTTTTTTSKPATKRPEAPRTPVPGPPVETMPPASHTTPKPVLPNFDPCAGGKCDKLSDRPNLETGAAVYVVFGLLGIDRSNVSFNHVLTEKGSVMYDQAFEGNFSLTSVNQQAVRDLCKLCKIIASNTDLVKRNGSQCIPRGLPDLFGQTIRQMPECQDLPGNAYVNGRALPAHAMAGYTLSSFKWIAFAFETTTFKGQSYFSAYKDYQKWEAFIKKIKKDHLPKDSPLQSIYQTSEFWKNVMMEIVAVSSAISGLVFSLIICVAAVAIFTGHILLLLIVLATILGVIGTVLALFYLLGWEMGAVEAVSLSILVGSSVDYCVHLVEGYLLAGQHPPKHINDDGKMRRWRTKAAIVHIGVSILSSALTTIVASIPLTQTMILPFSKFGQIVALNTTVSIVYSLTFCATFLALFGPARFTNGVRSTFLALGLTVVIVGLAILGLFLSARFLHFHIPGPDGEDLFPVPAD